MKKLIGTLAVLALALSGFTLVAAAPALAASQCATTTTVTSSSTTGAGGTTITLTATVKDCNGAGVAGATVTFSQTSGPCASVFSSTTATTDANGQASVTVTLPQNCPGQYTFAANGAGVLGSTTVVESGGFPATSAEPPSGNLPWEPLVVLAVGGLMIVAAFSALYIQRRRS